MEQSQQRLRTSPEQFSTLIQFMERHGDLSRPQTGAQGRLLSERLWDELTSLLNSVGGGVSRSSVKWKKVWADWKTKTKKKYSEIRRRASGTGGGPHSRSSLSTLEERVVAMIGVSAVVGLAGVDEQGFNIQPQEQQQQQQLLTPTALTPLLSMTPQISLPRTPPFLDIPLPSPPNQRPPTSSQRSRSSRPAGNISRQLFARLRRRRATPFERAATEFATIEQRRLDMEERRDRRFHEREMELIRLHHEAESRRQEFQTQMLQVESERVVVARQQNELLQHLGEIGQNLIGIIAQMGRHSLPSTEILSNFSNN